MLQNWVDSYDTENMQEQRSIHQIHGILIINVYWGLLGDILIKNWMAQKYYQPTIKAQSNSELCQPFSIHFSRFLCQQKCIANSSSFVPFSDECAQYLHFYAPQNQRLPKCRIRRICEKWILVCIWVQTRNIKWEILYTLCD